jgi:hypothetical protein
MGAANWILSSRCEIAPIFTTTSQRHNVFCSQHKETKGTKRHKGVCRNPLRSLSLCFFVVKRTAPSFGMKRACPLGEQP